MPNINLNAPSPELPLSVQQARQAQAQAMANALMAQSMKDESPVVHTGGSNPFARDVPNWGDAISKVVKAYGSGKMSSDAATRQGEIADKYQKTLSNDTSNVVDRIFPQEQPGIGPPSPDGTAAPNFTMAPDIPGAMKAGMGSQIPEVRNMTEALMKQVEDFRQRRTSSRTSRMLTPSRWRDYKAAGYDPAVLKEKAMAQIHDGVLTTIQGGKVVGKPVATDTYTDPSIDPVTKLPISKSTVTNKPMGLVGGETSTVKAMENLVAGADVDQLKSGLKDYNSAGGDPAYHRQYADYDKGYARLCLRRRSSIKQGVNKILEAVKTAGRATTSTGDALRAEAGKNMVEKMRILAPVDDKDIAKMESIVGTVRDTKQALSQILEIGQAAANRHENAITTSWWVCPRRRGPTLASSTAMRRALYGKLRRRNVAFPLRSSGAHQA